MGFQILKEKRVHKLLWTVLLVMVIFIAKTSYVIADDYAELIPEEYHETVSLACNGKSIETITKADIASVDNLMLTIDNAESLGFLSLFSHLKSIEIVFEVNDDRFCLDTIPQMKELTDVSIKASENLEVSSAVNNGFIENNKNDIQHLYLSGVDLGPGVIETMENLEVLKLDTSLNCEIDYQKLSVGKLDLSWYGPYDVPIFMDYSSYNDLKRRGIEIMLTPGVKEEDYINVWNMVDGAAKEMGSMQSDSEQKIVDTITAYVLKKLKYDKKMEGYVNDGTVNSNYTESFYVGGNLYAALEKDSSICGNYTAMIKALLKCYGINSFYVINDSHAWNLVLVDDELGYIDATYLDLNCPNASSQIIEGKGKSLVWYMEDPSEKHIREIDPDRNPPIVFPQYLKEAVSTQLITSTENEKSDTNNASQVRSNGLTEYPLVSRIPILLILIAFIAILISGLIVMMLIERRRNKNIIFLNPRKTRTYYYSTDKVMHNQGFSKRTYKDRKRF